MPQVRVTPETTSRRPLTESDKLVRGNIDRLYKQHGIIAGNQSALARAASIDQTFISKLLKGKTSISVSSLHNIAEALDVPVWCLLVPGEWELGNPPALAPVTDEERAMWEKIKEVGVLASKMAKKDDKKDGK